MSYLVRYNVHFNNVSSMCCLPTFIPDHVVIHACSSFPDVTICVLVKWWCDDTPVTLPKLSFGRYYVEAHETMQINKQSAMYL